MYYVYILKCKDGKHYTGCTSDLRDRYQRHVNGHVPATAYNLPVEIIFYCAFIDYYRLNMDVVLVLIVDLILIGIVSGIIYLLTWIVFRIIKKEGYRKLARWISALNSY